MAGFLTSGQVRQEQFDWGLLGWRLGPPQGAAHLVVIDVALEPGGGHDFHRHPEQEEIIIVKSGRVVQYLERDSQVLAAGDSAFVPTGMVHASFNDFEETALLQVVLAPSLGGETGYELEDVAGQEPWASLRAR